jgi:hypothetical protein
MQTGRVLLYVGLAIVALGLLSMLASKLGFRGLPGDIVLRRKNFTFFFPLVSSIVVSVVLTLLFNLFRR